MGHEIPSFPPFITDKLSIGMRDDNETQSRLTNRMDDAFCNRMCAAIAAGLESAAMLETPILVVLIIAAIVAVGWWFFIAD